MYDTESWTENVPRQLRCFSISCHSLLGAQATCTGSCFRSVGVRHVSQRVRCHVRGTSFACRVAFSSHFFNIARQLTVFFPPTHRPSVRFRQSTKDALEPLRVALESVLTDKNKPYVLLFIVLLAPVLLFTAHRVEQREKQAARIEGTRDKKEK